MPEQQSIKLNKLQAWIKNYKKFQPKQDLAEMVEEFIGIVLKFQKHVRHDPESHQEEIKVALGRLQMKLLEFCNEAGVEIEDVLQDKMRIVQ